MGKHHHGNDTPHSARCHCAVKPPLEKQSPRALSRPKPNQVDPIKVAPQSVGMASLYEKNPLERHMRQKPELKFATDSKQRPRPREYIEAQIFTRLSRESSSGNMTCRNLPVHKLNMENDFKLDKSLASARYSKGQVFAANTFIPGFAKQLEDRIKQRSSFLEDPLKDITGANTPVSQISQSGLKPVKPALLTETMTSLNPTPRYSCQSKASLTQQNQIPELFQQFLVEKGFIPPAVKLPERESSVPFLKFGNQIDDSIAQSSARKIAPIRTEGNQLFEDINRLFAKRGKMSTPSSCLPSARGM